MPVMMVEAILSGDDAPNRNGNLSEYRRTKTNHNHRTQAGGFASIFAF